MVTEFFGVKERDFPVAVVTRCSYSANLLRDSTTTNS